MLFFILLHGFVAGQTVSVPTKFFNGFRSKIIPAQTDTIQLDSLSIVPSTFHLFRGTQELDSSAYVLQEATARLILKTRFPDSLRAYYYVFPYSFAATRAHKNPDLLTSKNAGVSNPFVYVPGAQKVEDPFAFGGLNKSGSLSRGISFGNSRDVSVSSNLNLQLSGKITDNIELQLVATDDNLPLQPSGSTQQLQEFDKVFIQLSDPHTKLIAGDFFLNHPDAYFMNFAKRGQGITVTSLQQLAGDTGKQSSLRLTGSVAVSKGKFARNVIQGIESNQGPYRLRGAENELFIVVLAGTERVFVDGQLLKRGQENDYVIDYNTAEITFTARQLITKDKRIVVEFQYSDRNYTRSLFHAGVAYQLKKTGLHFNVYSEQDSKNQPLQQALTDADKQTLAGIGDNLLAAVASGADSVAFSGDLVLYRKSDTLVNAVLYQDIYVYSIDPDTAHWRLSFSNVGVQRGNYIQVSSSANGKVFQWVAPINGVPQGEYEPVILLVTPKKRQLLSAGIDQPLGKTTKASAELAYSINDVNTFSRFNSLDDAGYGARLRVDDVRSRNDSLNKQKWNSFAEYEWVSKTFTPIERYRSVEFDRDWNFGFNPGARVVTADQHLISAGTKWNKQDLGFVNYTFGLFSEDTTFLGFRHGAGFQVRKKGFAAAGDGSLLFSSGTFGRGQLIRQKVRITQRIKKIQIGIEEMQEQSLRFVPNTDTLNRSSFGFWEAQAFIGTADSSKRRLNFFYKQRRDYLPDSAALRQIAYAENIGGTLDLLGKPDRTLRTTVTWRRLQITNPLLTMQQPDNTLVGRTELGLRLWKGVVVSNTFYEAGSGLELKKEFSYIEVPAGQGNYTWTDYNSNGVRELNEFEVAVFNDQATFIRVFTPTNDYIKVFTNQFSQSVQLRPSVRWANAKGFKGFLARFGNQAALRIDRKTAADDVFLALTPMLGDGGDTALVTLNASVRNTISFNQLSSKFGMDFTWQEVRGKNLLTNGIESRGNLLRETRLRWNITRAFGFTVAYRDGVKSNGSEFFSSRNYRVKYLEAEPSLSFQPGTTFRVTGKYRYSGKANGQDLGGESAIIHKAGTEFKLNRASRGSLQAEINWIDIQYTGAVNSAVAFDMLEGLKPGQNFVWRLNWQRALGSSLQLSIGYEGRKTPNVNAIHTGTAQIRAVF
jgi:hypothetical protein